MKKQLIVLATPTLGVVSFPWVMSLQSLHWPMNCTRAMVPYIDEVGGQIDLGRNAIVARCFALENESMEVSHIFWLDDDVLCNASIINRLLSHNTDVAAGMYFAKGDCSQPLIFPGRGAGTGPWTPDEIFECYGWPMGLCLTRMSVFRRIRDELKIPNDVGGNPRFFYKPQPNDVKFEDGIWHMGGTEDFHFFDLVQQIGVKPVIDCTKFGFGWHYDINQKFAYPREQWEQFKAGEPVRWQIGAKKVVWEQGITVSKDMPRPHNASQEPSPESVPER